MLIAIDEIVMFNLGYDFLYTLLRNIRQVVFVNVADEKISHFERDAVPTKQAKKGKTTNDAEEKWPEICLYCWIKSLAYFAIFTWPWANAYDCQLRTEESFKKNQLLYNN